MSILLLTAIEKSKTTYIPQHHPFVKEPDLMMQWPGEYDAGFSILGFRLQNPWVDQMCIRNFWTLSANSKLFPGSDTAALRQLNPLHKMEP